MSRFWKNSNFDVHSFISDCLVVPKKHSCVKSSAVMTALMTMLEQARKKVLIRDDGGAVAFGNNVAGTLTIPFLVVLWRFLQTWIARGSRSCWIRKVSEGGWSVKKCCVCWCWDNPCLHVRSMPHPWAHSGYPVQQACDLIQTVARLSLDFYRFCIGWLKKLS